jgi:uncharacterized membrane protein
LSLKNATLSWSVVFLRGRGCLIVYLTGLALLLLSCMYESSYRAAAELEKSKIDRNYMGHCGQVAIPLILRQRM